MAKQQASGSASSGGTSSGKATPSTPTAKVVLEGASGAVAVTVEVARTLEEQNYGLMNRQSLAPDRGMIFPYDPPQTVGFWMKNTLIPLDIIFIGPGGKILNIAENTPPLSLKARMSDGPVEAVLELSGGRSAELGIKAGDRVDWAH